jgi:hypothetical protein
MNLNSLEVAPMLKRALKESTNKPVEWRRLVAQIWHYA